MTFEISEMIWSVFEHRPTPEIVVITLVVFTALLWLNIGIVNLWNKWNKRRKKLASTPPQQPPKYAD